VTWTQNGACNGLWLQPPTHHQQSGEPGPLVWQWILILATVSEFRLQPRKGTRPANIVQGAQQVPEQFVKNPRSGQYMMYLIKDSLVGRMSLGSTWTASPDLEAATTLSSVSAIKRRKREGDRSVRGSQLLRPLPIETPHSREHRY